MKIIYLSLIFIVLTSLSCTDENIKPSVDSQLATEAFEIIETVKRAYEEKRENILREHCETILADMIAKNLSFEKVDISFTTRLVKITGPLVKVNLNWHGVWWIAQERELADRGVADLVFQRETMKLIQIDGDNPFLIPSSR